jgi:hypothetical protein
MEGVIQALAGAIWPALPHQPDCDAALQRYLATSGADCPGIVPHVRPQHQVFGCQAHWRSVAVPLTPSLAPAAFAARVVPTDQLCATQFLDVLNHQLYGPSQDQLRL